MTSSRLMWRAGFVFGVMCTCGYDACGNIETCEEYYDSNAEPSLTAEQRAFCLEAIGKTEGNCCISDDQCGAGLRCCEYSSSCGGNESCECTPQ